MCKKKTSALKFRLFWIGALLALWWWVDHILKKEKKPLVESPAQITLPSEPHPVTISPKSQEILKEIIQENSVSNLEPQLPSDNEDDLQKIEGIGPKISSILKKAGINNFAKLGSLEPGQIKTILDQNNIRLAVPDTWPEQARMAARGSWQKLEELQSQLKGGRRL